MCANRNCQFNTPDLTWQCVGMKTATLIPLTWPDLTMCGNEKLPGYYPWPDLTMCGNENWQFNTPDLTMCANEKQPGYYPWPDRLAGGRLMGGRWAAPQAGTLHLPQWVEAGPRHSQQEAESPIVFFVILCNFKSFSIFVRVWLVFPRPVGAMDALCTCTCLASCSWLSFGTDYIFSLIWSESLAQTLFLVWSDQKLWHRLYF